MSFSASPPSKTVTVLRIGDGPSWAIWSLQKSLSQIGSSITVNGIFNEKTRVAVVRYQRNRGLKMDGVAGQATQRRIGESWIRKGRDIYPLPAGVPDELVGFESSWYMGSVGAEAEGGLDLSLFQRRVKPPWNTEEIERAFDCRYQAKLVCKTILERFERYIAKTRDGVLVNKGIHWPRQLSYIPTAEERAMRLALLYHNYQTAANRFAEDPDPHPVYWQRPAQWIADLRPRYFDDGKQIETPFEWCGHYSLSSPLHNHPGNVARGITDWSF